jgi:hypothetical protein
MCSTQQVQRGKEKKRQVELEITRKSELAQKQRAEEAAKEKERALVQVAHKKAQEEIRKPETELHSIEKEQHNILKSAEVLLSEAEIKLVDTIKQGDIDRVSVAHGLLEVARKHTANATKENGNSRFTVLSL